MDCAEVTRLKNILPHIYKRAEPGSEIESAARNAILEDIIASRPV